MKLTISGSSKKTWSPWRWFILLWLAGLLSTTVLVYGIKLSFRLWV